MSRVERFGPDKKNREARESSENLDEAAGGAFGLVTGAQLLTVIRNDSQRAELLVHSVLLLTAHSFIGSVIKCCIDI